MSEELPWFKAFPSQWLGGDIMYLPKEDKGSFIDACFHYWNKDCSMSYIKMSRRIGKDSLNDNEILAYYKYEQKNKAYYE